MDDEILDLCFDEYPDGERFEPAQLPSSCDLQKATSTELAMAWRKQWETGQQLRIRFLDGDPKLHERVIAHARRWLEHANLGFDFGNYAEAEIRITFRGRGYRSLVGTDALRQADPLPTMTLGGFTPMTDETTLRRTVLHEFGHALGCIHEQASPSVKIPWNEQKVYERYRTWQRWDDQTIYNNVLLRYTAEEAKFTQHDPTSIMQYPVPKELTDGVFEIGWNNDLSDTDKSFISRMYPLPTPPTPKPPS